MKYRVQYVGSSVINLHTTRLLLRGIEGFRRGDKPDKGRYQEFLAALLRIQGVERISPDNYDVQIVKGHMFAWEKILPRVHEAMQVYVAKNRPVQVMPATRQVIDGSGRAHELPA